MKPAKLVLLAVAAALLLLPRRSSQKVALKPNKDVPNTPKDTKDKAAQNTVHQDNAQSE